MTPHTFFVDRSLGKHAAPEALRKAGAHVELHDDHFDARTPDPVWLAKAGQRGWFVRTKDHRIRYRPLELSALREARVGTFVVRNANLTAADLAQLLLDNWAEIERICRTTEKPFIAQVSRAGVKLVGPRGPSAPATAR